MGEDYVPSVEVRYAKHEIMGTYCLFLACISLAEGIIQRKRNAESNTQKEGKGTG